MSDTDKQFSLAEVEAALCVWEYTDHNSSAANSKTTDEPTRWSRYRENVGSTALRMDSVRLGAFVLDVYDMLPFHVRDWFSYDWEIVPTIVETVSIEGGSLEIPSAAQALVMALASLNGEIDGYAARQR